VTPLISPLGDQAFRVQFAAAEEIDRGRGEEVLAAVGRLDAGRPPGVIDVVPGYASLLVIYDPMQADPAEVEAWLAERVAAAAPGPAPAGRRIEIPVFYDPLVAADLEELATDKRLTVAELIALHSGVNYRCFLLGFRPGFPFLGGLDARLFAARLATPRLRVPAGSVAIGGQQTGIYPVASPGGWRVIGRTPLRLFDSGRADPFLVQAGDEVVFRAIDRERFLALGGNLTS
jgi:inhibitor of KinA